MTQIKGYVAPTRRQGQLGGCRATAPRFIRGVNDTEVADA